ncbi:MAG TPA: molybdopterin-dependent oxidoreductase [Mucilaginibacter sp.]
MDQSDRIVAARMKLRERFKKQMEHHAYGADAPPMGTGNINRHGMPEVPIGQTVTDKWPVLDLGNQPKIKLENWHLEITGAVEHPLKLSWKEFMTLPQTKDTSDFHCVTTWSKLNMRWKGVRLIDLAALAQPSTEVTNVLCYGYDNYTTNLSIEEALKPDVLLVHTFEGRPLAIEHGGPVRMITPQLYAWKGSKWIKRIEFLTEKKRGFWEDRGYSDTAYPWRNDRYSV